MIPLLASILLAAPASHAPAQLLLTHANVVTLDPAHPRAEAIAIRGDTIVYVGDAAGAEAFAGPKTERIDLAGSTVVPGLVDAHAHVASLGGDLESLRLNGTTSWEAVVAAVAERVARAKPGEWIVGRGWDQNDWAVKEFPTHEKLSAVSPNNPVLLSRIDGHAVVVNALALRTGGVTRATADPPGGRILRAAAAGEPTGVLVDDAIDLVAKHVPSPTLAQVKARILRAQEACLAAGLTGIHDMGVGATELAAFEALDRERKLKLRVYALLDGGDRSLLKKRFARGPVVAKGKGRLTVRGFKLFADGALGSRGAALLADYADEPGNRGLLRDGVDEIARRIDEGRRAGFQVAVHAIGDAGNRAVLDAIESVRDRVERRSGGKPMSAVERPRIEHVQVLAPEDLPRLAKLGVVASMQPTHATSDMPWAEARLGKERVKGAYAWRTLLDSGASLAFGSDFPVEGVSPLWGIYAAVTRTDHQGSPAGGWLPSQKLSALEALAGFTTGAAYAGFDERSGGTIAAGRRADLTVLSRDLTAVAAAEILTTEVRMTVVGGEIVFRRDAS